MARAADLYQRMSRDQREALAHEYFPLWAAEFAVAPQDGKPLDLAGRPWLWDLYTCEAPEIVVCKANQVGVTLWALLRTLHSAAWRWPQGAIYFLPKKEHVGDFVRQKVEPIFRRVPGLHGRDMDGKDVDNVGMKRVGDSFTFFRGMESEAGRQSVSADGIVRDEMDLMDPEDCADAQQRLAGSPHKEVMDISRPSVPGFGIAKRFEESDQRYWTLRCGACNKDWTVEDTWPTCVKGRAGARYLACPGCGETADIKTGRWIARETVGKGRPAGFQVGGALNPHFDLDAAYELWTVDPATFTRAKLGLPYLEKNRGISADVILNLCADPAPYDQLERHPGATWGGSDVGNLGHLVVAEKGKDGKPRVIHLRRWTEVSELDRAMDLFHIHTMLVDAMPEKRAIRDFCRRWPNRAWMVFYDHNRRGSPRWDPNEHTVHVDRTETLDASFSPLYNGGVLIPRRTDPESRLFALHAQNEIRTVETLPNGDKIAKWQPIGPNHYRHGWNYCHIALSRQVYKTAVA